MSLSTWSSVDSIMEFDKEKKVIYLTEFIQGFLIFSITVVALVAICFGKKFGTKMFNKDLNSEFEVSVGKDEDNNKDR